jgi:hypothetical protein
VLEQRQIVYFDDPFGKIKYQSDEDLERDIGAIVDSVRLSSGTYVIITSREEVFKEFKQRHFSEIDLKKFELRLKIKTPSYDYERRQKMILNCSRLINCKWLKSDTLVNLVLGYIQDPTKLSSPLKRDFAVSTKDVFTKHGT